LDYRKEGGMIVNENSKKREYSEALLETLIFDPSDVIATSNLSQSTDWENVDSEGGWT